MKNVVIINIDQISFLIFVLFPENDCQHLGLRPLYNDSDYLREDELKKRVEIDPNFVELRKENEIISVPECPP